MSEINAESTTMPPVELRMPRASEREEMLAGKLYNSVDPELNALREKAGDLCARFNAASRTDHAARAAILDELLPGHGAGLDVMGPIFFDYGCNITIGERVFANFNFTVLDCCPVTIGDDVLFGPNVSLLPPMHPLRWQDRNVRQAPDGSAYDCEYGKPIVIGSHPWVSEISDCHRLELLVWRQCDGNRRRDDRRGLRDRCRLGGDARYSAAHRGRG